MLFPKGLRKGAKFLKLCREYLDRAVEEKLYKQDLISHALKVENKTTGESPSPGEIWEEAKFIVAAGKQFLNCGDGAKNN